MKYIEIHWNTTVKLSQNHQINRQKPSHKKKKTVCDPSNRSVKPPTRQPVSTPQHPRKRKKKKRLVRVGLQRSLAIGQQHRPVTGWPMKAQLTWKSVPWDFGWQLVMVGCMSLCTQNRWFCQEKSRLTSPPVFGRLHLLVICDMKMKKGRNFKSRVAYH